MGFIKGFGYAARGIWYCIRHERNFRVHLGIAAYVLGFAPYFSLSRTEWAVLTVLIALVLCAEAVNTAVERTVDLASVERQPRARAAKDAAAGAVLLCALAAVVVGILFFARPDVWGRILADFLGQPYKIVLLLLSFPVLLGFILRGGARDKP